MVAHADAFIDESGQRATTSSSSDHFVMSAVVIPRTPLRRLEGVSDVEARGEAMTTPRLSVATAARPSG
jgi:hypothetical protein